MSAIHSTTERIGDWMTTFSGLQFWPLDPRPEEILIEDIAHSLSMQCRYGGHCSHFYSVAEHSLRMVEQVPESDRLWALLHDAAEAYLVDLPRPIKRHSQLGSIYREVEDRLMGVICERFGLPQEQPESVKRADQAMLCIETKALLPVNSWWRMWEHYTTGKERPVDAMLTLSPFLAEANFMRMYRELVAKK